MVAVFERLYAIFMVTPFGSPKIKAVKKARKHYHFDWSLAPDPAARFEVAVEDGKPVLFAECKASDREVSPALRYLKARFPRVDAWQISAAGTRDYVSREGIRVAPALELLSTLV